MTDRLLTSYMLEWYIYLINADSVLADAMSTVKGVYYLDLLKNLGVTTSVGSNAYNFTLTDTGSREVRLSDFRGKIVFVDFWFTGCENCISYYSSVLSPIEKEFQSDTNIQFITINIDRTKEQWLRSLHGGEYSSLFICNLNTNGKGTDDEVIRHYKIEGYPRPLLINRDQTILNSSFSEMGTVESLRRILNKALE